MKNTIARINELNNQLRDAKKALENEFWIELKNIFDNNPKLESISMYVNNHEFNDGDATTFYLGYDDMTITVDDEEVGREWDSKTKEYVSNPTLDSLIELFENTQDIHEDMFSGEYENMTIDRDDVLNRKN